MRRSLLFATLLAIVAARPSGDDKSKSDENHGNSTEASDDAMSHLIRKRWVDSKEQGDNETKVEEHEEPKVVPIESARKKRDDMNMGMFNPTTPSGFINGAVNAWNGAQAGLQQMGQGAQEAANSAWNTMQQAANSAVQGAQNLGNQIYMAANNWFGQSSTPNMFPNNGNFGNQADNNWFGQASTPNMFPNNGIPGMSPSTISPYLMGVNVPGSQPDGFFQKAGNWFKNIFSG